MKSEKDRELFGVVIKQETKTGFMSLTDLQEAYTHARVLNGWTDKQVSKILNYEQNRERIYYLLKEQGLVKSSLELFMEDVHNTSLLKVLKGCKAYKTTGRGEN